MDLPIDDDFDLQPPPRKGGFAGLLQRAWPAREPVPNPFRESDFVGSEWGPSALEPGE